MFKTQLGKQAKTNPIWWIALVVIGAALMLVLKQVSPAPSPTTPPETTPAATAQPYLAEYNPDAGPLFEAKEETDNRSGWEISIDVILKLGIVLGLVFVAMHGLRWLQRHRHQNVSGGATINVLETTGLTPGRSLHLVVVGEKTLLLGATDHQISVLAELAEASIPVPDEEASFEETLSRQTHSDPEPPPPPINDDDEAAEYSPDWHATLNHLRSGIRQIQQAIGG